VPARSPRCGCRSRHLQPEEPGDQDDEEDLTGIGLGTDRLSFSGRWYTDRGCIGQNGGRRSAPPSWASSGDVGWMMTASEVLPGVEPEPVRPGWYPIGDGKHQRFYAGSDLGWENSYALEIRARDPRKPPASRQSASEIMMFVAVCVILVLVVTLLVLYA